MNIILTVPHAIAINNQRCKEHRYCDSLAIDAANIIQKTFVQHGIPSIILLGDINRSKIDLNRLESRNKTVFRDILRKSINNKSIVIDIHSFPNTEQWGFADPQKAIFLYDADIQKSPLAQIISKSNKLLKGINNDIQDEMHELGLESILLEVNENYLEYVSVVATQLVSAIKNTTF